MRSTHRNIKYILIVQIFLISFVMQGCVKDRAMGRSEKMKTFLNKRRVEKATKKVADQINIKLDIPYSKDINPFKKLDIYFPEGEGDSFPVLIHFHGGGWVMGDKNNTKEHGLFYASQGIIFISVNYRLSPKVKHPVHVEDCTEAVAWIFEHLKDLGGDIDRVFISGHSAGAYLAALLGADPKYLQEYNLTPDMLAGVISIDTASFDLTSENNEKLVKRFIKQSFGSNPKTLLSASPMYNVSNTGTYPNFLILASGERETSIAQGEGLANRLNNVGSKARFIVIDDHSHREMNQGMYEASDPVGSEILKAILTFKD